MTNRLPLTIMASAALFDNQNSITSVLPGSVLFQDYHLIQNY